MGLSRIETNRLRRKGGTAEPLRRKIRKPRGVQGNSIPGSSPSIALRDTKQVVMSWAGLRACEWSTASNNLAGIGICAFPCSGDNTGAQWLDADSLIRLPLRGQRWICLPVQNRIEIAT